MSEREHCPCGDFKDRKHACPVTYAELEQQLTNLDAFNEDYKRTIMRLEVELAERDATILAQQAEIANLIILSAQDNHHFFKNKMAVSSLFDVILLLEGKEARPSPPQGDY